MALGVTTGWPLRRLFAAALCAVVVEASEARASQPAAAVLVYDEEGAAYGLAARTCAAELAGEMAVELLTVAALTSGAERPGWGAAAPAVYLAAGPRAAAALAQRAPEGAPLRYCLVASPAALGLADRPNTVGVLAEVSVEEQMRLLQRAVPAARRVGVLYDSRSRRSAEALEQARRAAEGRLAIVAEDVARCDSFTEALDRLFSRDVDVLWMIADPAVYNAGTVRATLIRALRQRTPVFGFSASLVRAGAAMGVQIDPADQGRRLAELAREALQRQNPVQAAKALAPRALFVYNPTVVEKMRSRFSREALAAASEVDPR